jgi:hypothetical protein
VYPLYDYTSSAGSFQSSTNSRSTAENSAVGFCEIFPSSARDLRATRFDTLKSRSNHGTSLFVLVRGRFVGEPRASLEMLAAELGQSPRAIYENLLSYFSAYKAPPRDDRPCGAAEVESILCKYKGARNKHYRVGKDIDEVRHALQGWGTTAANLLRHLPAAEPATAAGE